MNFADRKYLIGTEIDSPGGVWADFGSGRGAFTEVLLGLLPKDSRIFSIDANASALAEQRKNFNRKYSGCQIEYLKADFTKPLPLPPLSGIVMANALHFQKNKINILKMLCGYLETHGKLILVEYNIESGNRWVPYPITYPSFEKIARDGGFKNARLIATVPSRFHHQVYSAVCQK
jgi:ubiquinone/menaquinone biosynthesis C-methylase UbiE